MPHRSKGQKARCWQGHTPSETQSWREVGRGDMALTRPRKIFLKASLHSADPEGDSGCPLGPEILTWPGHANLWESLCLTLGLSEPSLNGPSLVTTTFYCICPHVSVLARGRHLIVESESHLLPQLQLAMEIFLWPLSSQAVLPGGRQVPKMQNLRRQDKR